MKKLVLLLLIFSISILAQQYSLKGKVQDAQSGDAVVGEAFITLFSWDRDIPFSELFKLLGSVRPDRVLKL